MGWPTWRSLPFTSIGILVRTLAACGRIRRVVFNFYEISHELLFTFLPQLLSNEQLTVVNEIQSLSSASLSMTLVFKTLALSVCHACSNISKPPRFLICILRVKAQKFITTSILYKYVVTKKQLDSIFSKQK